MDDHSMGYCTKKQPGSGATKVKKITVIKQTLSFSGVTKIALDTPEKKASLAKSIAKALGVSGNDRITIVIIGILDKVMTTGGGTRRRLNTAGAEIIYEVRIEEAEDSEDTAPPESGSPATSIPVITVSSIESKMNALAAATSRDSSNSALGTAGATTLSEIKSAVAAQAGVDVASIKTEASAPEVSVREVEKEEVEDNRSNSDQSNTKVSGDSGAKDQGEIGSIIGAVAGSLALFGVAGVAFWIYRNEARKKRDATTAKRSGHGYQNSFNPLQQNEASIELAVAMPSHDGSFVGGRASMTNNPNNPKSAVSIGFAKLPPPPPPPGPGLKRKVQVALYDYEANGAGEISIRAGDTLIPTEHGESNADWTTGTNVRTEEVGFYPSQYVKDQL
jgi:hypothetical protein